jgi:hypothetical protein
MCLCHKSYRSTRGSLVIHSRQCAKVSTRKLLIGVDGTKTRACIKLHSMCKIGVDLAAVQCASASHTGQRSRPTWKAVICAPVY